ncbi:MAG TPA: trypsin-like peptidase domain-containing protein, partial [Actinomycetota bacterium]|nr:trypsin-like peptidase domain-containing protein [Actinomycetota bacterium]
PSGQPPYWTPPTGPGQPPSGGATPPYWTPYGATHPYGPGQPPYSPGPPPWQPPPPPRSFSQRLLPWAKGLLAAALVAVVLFVVANAFGAFRQNVASIPTGTDASLRTAATTPPSGTAPALDIRSVLRAVEPGVITISTTGPTGNFGGQSQGQGTGMVLDSQGNVLTNAHVVAGATTVNVQVFGQPTIYQAKVLGADTADDVAIIQIQNAGPLTPVPLGHSSGLQVGDPVVAIGNALGLSPGGPTVTSGIISGLNRSLSANNQRLVNLIQTDAPINPGNSGGPLVDAGGQVIGMNTAVSNDGQNVGFAIAIDRITPLVDSLKKGTVPSSNQGFLGVSIQNAPSGGAQITAVTPGSPATAAGLQVGDVITAVNGQAVATSAEAADAVASNPAGSKVTIKFRRGGASRTVTATLTSRPATG